MGVKTQWGLKARNFKNMVKLNEKHSTGISGFNLSKNALFKGMKL